MELTVLKTAVDQLTVWGQNGEHVVLQPNDFMYQWFFLKWCDPWKCDVGRYAIYYDRGILQMTKTEKDHNIHK